MSDLFWSQITSFCFPSSGISALISWHFLWFTPWCSFCICLIWGWWTWRLDYCFEPGSITLNLTFCLNIIISVAQEMSWFMPCRTSSLSSTRREWPSSSREPHQPNVRRDSSRSAIWQIDRLLTMLASRIASWLVHAIRFVISSLLAQLVSLRSLFGNQHYNFIL